MENCLKKDLLYNEVTKRCYKSCEKKNKVTHPVTKKCREKCKGEKIRRTQDFRCVKNPLNLKKNTRKIYPKKTMKTNEQITKALDTKALDTKVLDTKALDTKALDTKALDTKVLDTKALDTKAEVLEERKEELVPPPLQKELQKNFQFLHELIKKGEGRTVNYNGDMVSEFITVYFHEKYKQYCPMYPIKTYSRFDSKNYKEYYEKFKEHYTEREFKKVVLENYKYEYIDWNKDKFLKNLKLCLETGEQLILVPLRIPRHLNMLIIKVSTREIIRFEPHGSTFIDETIEKQTNTFLEELTKDINFYLKLADNRKFTYVNPIKICPFYNPTPSYFFPGFQYIEDIYKKIDKNEGGGFCQLWSWFFAECVIQNPKMDIKQVYIEAFKALTPNVIYFANIIRGYFYSINDELKKMKKNFTIEKSDKSKSNDVDILLEYLRQSQVNLKNKERKTFQGGMKKNKFILPKPNPKAVQMKL